MMQVVYRIHTDTPWFLIAGVLACMLIVFALQFDWKSAEPLARRFDKRLLMNEAIAGAVSFAALWFVATKIDAIPIYGFGLMLFLAFVICIWLAGRRAIQAGVAKELIQDVAIWTIVGGVIGARTTFLLVEEKDKVKTIGDFFSMFFRIWDGGLVYYGSLIGGAVVFCLVYYFHVRKHGVGFWKLADIYAPPVALGLCIGRIGCLLNGCCYGDVACPECAAISFPLSAYPRYEYTSNGKQTAAGFTLSEDSSDPAVLSDQAVVGAVEPDSAAELAGLKKGDVITEVQSPTRNQAVDRSEDLAAALGGGWPRGDNSIALQVRRAGEKEPLIIGPFRPHSLGLYPTQIHESISTLLLFLLMLAFEPFKPREGALIMMFLLFYPIHRFFDEMLRNDTEPLKFDMMTLSQNISIAVFAGAVLVCVWMWRSPSLAIRAGAH